MSTGSDFPIRKWMVTFVDHKADVKLEIGIYAKTIFGVYDEVKRNFPEAHVIHYRYLY